MNEKTKKYLKFLNYLYDCFAVAKNNVFAGQVHIDFANKCKEHNVSQYTSIALVNLNIIERIGKGVFSWKSTAIPNQIMAADVANEISNIVSGYNKTTRNNKKSVPRNLTPVADYERASDERAFEKMIKASKIADLLGVNINKLEKEKVLELMKTI